MFVQNDNGQIRTYARYADDFNSVIRINFWRMLGDKRHVLIGDHWDVIDPYEAAIGTEYGVHIDKTAAQMLMDSLWDCGIRPSNGEGNAGQLSATTAHLNDMRNIVKQLMEVVVQNGK